MSCVSVSTFLVVCLFLGIFLFITFAISITTYLTDNKKVHTSSTQTEPEFLVVTVNPTTLDIASSMQ